MPNKKRLLNVARALRESATPKKFKMSIYAHPCGTPACALGNYAARNDLQRDFVVRPTVDVFPDSRSSGCIRSFLYPEGDRVHYDSEEVLTHFGIDDQQAEVLFGDRGCGAAKTSIAAAEFIEKWVKQNA